MRRRLMCEYCGCQQIATIAELYREHDSVVAVIAQIRSSLAGDRLEDVTGSCRQILAILAPHTVVEEEGLFPALSQEFQITSKRCALSIARSRRCWGRPTAASRRIPPGRTGWLASC